MKVAGFTCLIVRPLLSKGITMHNDIINAALALSTIVRFLDDEQRLIFMKYIDFVSKKAAAGEITSADDYLTVIDEFADMLINDEI